MISIQLSNVTLILGARTIFRELTWEIQHDQKIGLIGPNGAGKSSLLKAITGEYSPEPGGAVARAKGVTVGYLPQQPELDPSQTAFEAALDRQPTRGGGRSRAGTGGSQPGRPGSLSGTRKPCERALARQQALLEEYDASGRRELPRAGARAAARAGAAGRRPG